MNRVLRAFAVPVLAVASLATSAIAETYKVDPTHAAVVFKIQHNGVSHVWGTFANATGVVTIDGDTGSVEVSVKADTVNSANAKRDEHLKSNAFFDVKQFPNISFKSTKVVKSADGYTVTGDLSLHGVTKEITITLVATEEKPGMQGNTVRGFDTSFTIKRSDFGIKTYLGPIGDEVTLFISLETAKS